MSYDEYWNGDPWAAQAYHKAQRLKNERSNQELWLQGLYIYDAFGVVMANAFSKKGTQPKKYTEEPIQIYPDTPEQAEMKKQKAIQNATEYFNNLMKAQKKRNKTKTE